MLGGHNTVGYRHVFRQSVCAPSGGMSLACRVAWRPLRGIARCAGERQRPHHHRLIRRFAFVGFALACTSAVPASATLIMHRDLSLSVARSIAEEAVAACAAKTYAVSTVVVGRDGETIVEMRGDETAPHTMENARRKAYSAMTFRQPTAEYAKKLQDPNSVAGDFAERHCHSRRATDQDRH